MPIRRSLTDLSVLADAVVSVVRVADPSSDIAVETRGDPTFHCDFELTRRVVENLVSNAVKVTRVGGRVRVVLSGSRERAFISVTDEGPTIPMDQRAHVFEPYRGDRLWNAAGDEASGLSLAFCRLAVEAQGGTIRIENGTPRGNVFVVELLRSQR